MPLLALDTSSVAAAAVVDATGHTLATRAGTTPRRHAEELLPLVEGVLAEAGVARTELTSIVVGTGPAPFTGLRVGLVTARSLARALGVPVHGVSSLDALALATVTAAQRGTGPQLDGRQILVTTDARRKEIYWARYQGVVEADGADVVRTAGPGVDSAAAVAAAGLDGVLVVGPGAELTSDLPVVAGVPTVVDPADLARVAMRRLAGDPQADLPTAPLYLRRPDAVPPAAVRRMS